MANLNLCQFIGNAGANPEVRQFDNGNKIAQVRIAVTERWTDRNNQPQESTEWIPLVFNGKLADIAAQYIVKGSSMYVSGKWKTREWTDQQGSKHYATELRVDVLQLVGPRPQAQQQPAPQAPVPQYAPAPQYQQAPPQYSFQPQAAPPQYQQATSAPQPQYASAPQPAPQAAPAPQYQSAPAPVAPPPGADDLPF